MYSVATPAYCLVTLVNNLHKTRAAARSNKEFSIAKARYNIRITPFNDSSEPAKTESDTDSKLRRLDTWMYCGQCEACPDVQPRAIDVGTTNRI